jgi:adenylylsulfate kinase
VTGGAVVWLTGLPASGKTTLAARIRDRLTALGAAAVLLDSDALRPVLAPELDYQPAARDEFYRRLAELAALIARQGCVAVVAATAPTRAQRARARASAPRFLEVYLDVGVEECAARDPKGLYARARAGAAPDLPGAGAPYEPPEAADVTARGGLDDAAVDAVVAELGPARGRAARDTAA